MAIADVNDHRIFFEDSGGDGPPVILGHGFLMDHEMFAPQVDALTPEFRVITWDERGFGQTPALGPFSYWDSASDCLGLLSHLAIEQAVVGGMSQGGFLALRAALSAPSRVKALLLFDTQAGIEDEATRQGFEALRDSWIQNGPASVRDVVAGLIIAQPEMHGAWFEKWDRIPTDQFALAFDCLAGRDDITARLPSIEAPALVVHGEADTAIPMDRAEELCAGLGNCVELVRVPGAAHAANLTHPDVVNPPVLSFLRKYA